MILLDTNILIEVFKGNTTVITAVLDADPKSLALSSITAMESADTRRPHRRNCSGNAQ